MWSVTYVFTEYVVKSKLSQKTDEMTEITKSQQKSETKQTRHNRMM